MTEYNLTEAVENVADQTGYKPEAVRKIALALVDDFKRQMKQHGEIHLTGFGSMVIRKRLFRNPFTLLGGTIQKFKIKFSASKLLEREINQ